MSMKRGLARAWLAAWLLLAPLAWAAEDYDRIHFTVEVQREVENDLGRAMLRVELEDEDAASLAGAVNGIMAWAQEQLPGYPAVEAKTGTYQIRAIYRKQHFSHWRATQLLELQSADIAQLGGLLETLQTRLQMQFLGFEISPARRQAVEDQLIGEALEAFKRRAALVRDNFRAHKYRLVALSINTGGQAVPPVPGVQVQTVMTKTPPALTAGRSRLVVQISGSIELD